MRSSEAARRLGISIKALRLYERRGLLAPTRTSAGYRVYGPDAMERAARIVAFRVLGLSLAQIARVLEGDPSSVDVALAAHERALASEIGKLARTIGEVRKFRVDATPRTDLRVSFELPWPWAGELFELVDIRPINYIVGPLGSGKTRFAQRLAEALPGASFLGLERMQAGVEPLIALLAGIEADGPSAIVVDMVEEGLEEPTQEALIACLRRRAESGARPLFLMTRSSSILNLERVGPHEAILLCPANHSPPTRVAPYPGAPGYEAVATCLATPAVRARTAGVIAWRPTA
ncbi:MAG TPA: MerR family transcriptional regulator [Steroidobacteraceae bacterium]|nr:MerR family transcriptional regulator [Steroidobacteraceae bacterium]